MPETGFVMVGLQQGLASVLLLLLLLNLQAVGNSVVPEECHPCTPSCALNITVSRNGNDTECLLQSDKHCRTLEYVLANLSSHRNDCVRVTVDYSHDFNFSVNLTCIHNLAIIGREQKPVITYCSHSALSFKYSGNISIQNIAWEQCSNGNINPSTLLFTHCHNVKIINCSFLSKQGSTGTIMYDVHGDVHVNSTKFTNSIASTSYPISASNRECIPSGGLFIYLTSSYECSNYTNYVVSSCYFADSSDSGCACDQQNHSLGNALFLRVYSSYYSGSTFHIVGNTFENNTYSCPSERANVHATFVLSLEIGSYERNMTLSSSEKNQFMIEKNLFHRNTGVILNDSNVNFRGLDMDKSSALGIYCEGDCSRNEVIVKECNFTDNSALAGTVVVKVSSESSAEELVRFQNCSWYSNTANSSGAAVTLFKYRDFSVFTTSTCITFAGCRWEGNKIIFRPTSHGLSGIQSQRNGVLVSEGILLSFEGNTMFENNSATALHLYRSILKLSGNVTFVDNRASSLGGAVYLNQAAWIVPLSNLELNFVSNSARFGGAIYKVVADECYSDFESDFESPCTVFGTESGTQMCDNFPKNTSISFVNNTASVSANAIYLESKNCKLDCLHGEIFSYIPNNTDEISTPAIYMYFNDGTLNITLGQNIFLNITTSTEDYDNSTVPAVAMATVYLSCDPGSEYTFDPESPSAVFLQNKPFFSNLRVRGPEIADGSIQKHCAIHLVTAGLQPSLEQFLQLNLLPCTYGYVYDTTSQMCKCFDSNHIRCNDTSVEACIEYGYWYGEILDSKPTMEPCPIGYCQYSSGGCPVGECEAVPGFCKLPTDKEDGLCSESRGNVLCTACTTNHTFTFGAVRCVKKCSDGYSLIPIFLLLVFWSVMILTVLVVLKLNLRVGSGKLYAFIYYFSVVQYVTPGYLPSEFLNVVLTIFASVTKLNPLFIGEIPVCFTESMNSIDHQFFQYVHPLLIALAIFITIVLARFFPRLPNPAKNSTVPAICILMLLSFSSLVETSFNLLNPVKFKNSEKVYVNIQADTEFFDPEKHLAFAVIAILVLTLIIFPFMLLMFFSPFLEHCGVNLTKTKPILDEYQACYKNKWRWVAGFYFLCRIVVFFVSILDVGVYGHLYIFQIFFLLTVVLHATFQPYTAQWLNIIDTLFLSDLAMISLLYGSTADNLFHGNANAQIVRDILLHVLLLIPCFYFICIVVYILLTHTWLKRCILKCCNKQRKVTTHYVTFSTASNMTDGESSYEVYDREPLLAILSEEKPPKHTKYETFTSSVSSSEVDLADMLRQVTKEKQYKVADQTM